MLLIEQFGQQGAASFNYQFDASFRDLSKCCFRPPLAEPRGCQVSCSLPEHYATSATLHTGTVLLSKTTACLPNLERT
jgi:hypothetical protein